MDFKEYFLKIDNNLEIYNIYIPKPKGEILDTDSKLFKILKLKNFDIVITIISNNNEVPILLVEYSTAVPTDDHKMQRSDVYFWAGMFKIPVMKISPFFKGSSGKHGGGEKLNTKKNEQTLALNSNSIVYFIDFKADKNNNLITNKQYPSCMIKSQEIATSGERKPIATTSPYNSGVIMTTYATTTLTEPSNLVEENELLRQELARTKLVESEKDRALNEIAQMVGVQGKTTGAIVRATRDVFVQMHQQLHQEAQEQEQETEIEQKPKNKGFER